MKPMKEARLDSSHGETARRRRPKDRGVAMLMVLMIVFALMVLGQLIMTLMNSVTHRSGTYRREQNGDYCAEEGLALGRAWIAQNAPTGVLPNQILSGAGAGGLLPVAAGGLLADPTSLVDLKAKDLCKIGAKATVGGMANVNGLQGLCRLDSLGNPLYQIDLVDDVDEIPPAKVNPWVDNNGTIILRSECLTTDSWHCSTYSSGAASAKYPARNVVSMEFVQIPAS